MKYATDEKLARCIIFAGTNEGKAGTLGAKRLDNVSKTRSLKMKSNLAVSSSASIDGEIHPWTAWKGRLICMLVEGKEAAKLE